MLMKNQNFWMGVAIAVGLFALGVLLKSGMENFKDRERVVSVKGLCEEEVAADYVIWPLVYKEVGNDLLSITQSVSDKNKEIVRFLKEKGIEESEISVAPPALVDLEADRYRSEKTPYRYNITSVVTVASKKVDLVSSLILQQAELLKKGIALTSDDYRYQTVYSFNGLNDIKPAMIEKATKNAREAAVKFAEDSGSKLGKIRTADQGTFSITDRDSNTPSIKIVRVVTRIDYYLE